MGESDCKFGPGILDVLLHDRVVDQHESGRVESTLVPYLAYLSISV